MMNWIRLKNLIAGMHEVCGPVYIPFLPSSFLMIAHCPSLVTMSHVQKIQDQPYRILHFPYKFHYKIKEEMLLVPDDR